MIDKKNQGIVFFLSIGVVSTLWQSEPLFLEHLILLLVYTRIIWAHFQLGLSIYYYFFFKRLVCLKLRSKSHAPAEPPATETCILTAEC